MGFASMAPLAALNTWLLDALRLQVLSQHQQHHQQQHQQQGVQWGGTLDLGVPTLNARLCTESEVTMKS